MSMTTQFSCPSCDYAYTKATSTNKAKNGKESRRRRVCLNCKAGFVTYEINAGDYQFLQAARKWICNPVLEPAE